MALSRRLAALVLAGALAASACATAGPPRGEAYEPTNSPEAPTQCPDQAKAAREAREAALGTDDEMSLEQEGNPARIKQAQAVFAHADCERAVFDRVELNSTDPDEFKRQLGVGRAQFYTVKTLYDEVVNLGVPALVVAAHTRLGDLHGAYANKLRRSDPGPLVAADRAAWASEIEDIVAPVEREAAKAYDKALEVIEIGPAQFASEPDVAPHLLHACTELRGLDAAAAAEHKSCRALPK